MSPLDLSLINGPIPVAVIATGGVALLYLAFGLRHTRFLPLAAVACTVLTVGFGLFVNKVWRPFPEPLPPIVPVCLGAALLGTTLAVARARRSRWYTKVLSATAALLLIISGLSVVNQFFGQYPTVRAALGTLVADTKDLDDVAKPATELDLRGKRLKDVWQPPKDLPEKGTVSEAEIPSSTNFRPRNAWVYLPPAYAATPRPRLPVLVLLSGQPGTTRDWLDAGQLAKHLDEFAKQHKGLAPIVVMPDQLGTLMANPICVDSELGMVETYLAKDVPNWIKQRLQVDENRAAWTIGGFSQGGTCAWQLAVRAPKVYRQFIDIAGQSEPSLGDHRTTVRDAFGGDEKAFSRVNPIEIMATTRFPDTAGVVVAGKNDPMFRDQDREVFEACQRAGMDMRWLEFPGGHDWNVWRPGLRDSLPWLAERTGLAG